LRIPGKENLKRDARKDLNDSKKPYLVMKRKEFNDKRTLNTERT